MKIGTCASCRFFDDKGGFSMCRRFPPNTDTHARWAKVAPIDWCGEWKAAAEALEEVGRSVEDFVAEAETTGNPGRATITGIEANKMVLDQPPMKKKRPRRKKGRGKR